MGSLGKQISVIKNKYKKKWKIIMEKIMTV